MPENNTNAITLPSTGVITTVRFGSGTPHEIGLGTSTRQAIEAMFDAVNTTIEDNEEVVSNSLNDLEERKADKSGLSDYATKTWIADEYYSKDEIDDADKVVSSALNVLEQNKADKEDIPILYNTTGSATDGTMTQNAITQELQVINCGSY